MSKPEQAGTHYEGPLEIAHYSNYDGFSLHAKGEECIAERWPASVFDPERLIATAKLLRASYNSYDKHCGSRAVELAEGDLLGEALGALGTISRTSNDSLMREISEKVLAKLEGK